jgi:hypothetical protein
MLISSFWVFNWFLLLFCVVLANIVIKRGQKSSGSRELVEQIWWTWCHIHYSVTHWVQCPCEIFSPSVCSIHVSSQDIESVNFYQHVKSQPRLQPRFHDIQLCIKLHSSYSYCAFTWFGMSSCHVPRMLITMSMPLAETSTFSTCQQPARATPHEHA